MSIPNYSPGPTTTGYFQGDLFKNVNGTKKNITLTTSTDYITESVLEIGSAVILEIPATSSLEIESWVDQPYLNNTFASETLTLTNKTFDSTSPTAFFYPGFIQPYAGFIGSALSLVPRGWLACYGQAVSQSTYANLFSAICPNLGAVTITNASPAVVTLSGHGFVTGDQIYFNGSGTINTGLSQNTNYFVIYIGANTFNLATTLANAEAGTKIATSGALSGTINCYAQPYGGASSTTFNIPDLRGNVLAGADAMGGSAASRMTNNSFGGQGSYGNLGATGGEQSHTDVSNEMPAHTHTYPGTGNVSSGSNFTAVTANVTSPYASSSTGSGDAHNNVQPTTIVNYIIKT